MLARNPWWNKDWLFFIVTYQSVALITLDHMNCTFFFFNFDKSQNALSRSPNCKSHVNYGPSIGSRVGEEDNGGQKWNKNNRWREVWVILGTKVKCMEPTLGGFSLSESSSFLCIHFILYYRHTTPSGEPHAGPPPQHASLPQNPSPITLKLPSCI